MARALYYQKMLTNCMKNMLYVELCYLKMIDLQKDLDYSLSLLICFRVKSLKGSVHKLGLILGPTRIRIFYTIGISAKDKN